MDVSNNNPLSNSTISDSSNSTSTGAKNNDTLPEHNPNNLHEVIDLTVEDLESEKYEDSIKKRHDYHQFKKIWANNNIRSI